ncbi:Smr/MutS family protein [Kordiimonas sp. SCSIO 12610]|uniref:Smr/MutS family protein n=1 Tax=Kordiimonas sp. SCSIO 12610 TaxID=2829597 RepID=UPI002109901A|nr:Smr/MutS family protein [Kordiimonas sp. SCSIO 12610]UTW55440.1 Smr/MutS family protein [Kordiimonas sp. SCSIO 12610]
MPNDFAKKGKNSLSDQDQQLWDEVKKTVKPLKKVASSAGKPAIKPRRMIARKEEAREIPAEWYLGQSPTPDSRIDRKTKRRIASGIKDVDRSIDLHGMTQDQAYRILKNAVEGGIRRGDKTLLVVTGKGGRRFSQLDNDTPVAYRTREQFDQHGGVLKRLVPVWLQSSEIRPFIESFDSAAKEHGGEGALYILLRKKLPTQRKP